ncbi:MAG: GAF domain-containing protein [Deltaproteobacteria bacterium]|nr:GAF domain-containing protein [Deltaproteobacteria bacterium]
MKGKEVDYFTALYDVAKVINASLEPAKVLEKIVQSVVKAMGVKAGIIRLLDSRERMLVLGAASGLSKGYVRKGPILIDESGLDRKALKGKAIWIENAQTDRNFQYGEKARAEGIKSVFVVPLMLEKKPIGVLRVYSDKVRKFREGECKFLKAVANLSAIALDNARMHETLQMRCDLMAAHKYRIDDN